MDLSVWHWAAFEPTVENFIDSSQLSFSLFWFDGQVIDMLSVEIGDFLSCQFFEFPDWSNTNDFLSVIWDPQRNWVTPVSVSWEAPIFSIFKPVVKSLFLNVLWNPGSFVIVLNKVFLEISNLNEPGWDCLVNQWSVTSPTERVVMDCCSTLNNSTLVLNVLCNYFIRFLDINSLIWWAFFRKFTVLVKWDWRFIGMDDTFGDTDLVIFLTESWSTMNDTSTWIFGNKVCAENLETSSCFSVNKEIKHWKILFSFQIFSFKLVKNFISFLILSIKSLGSTFCQNEHFISLGIQNLNVIHFRLDCKSQVGWQSPWSGGPDHKLDVVILNQWETDVKWRVTYFFIVELDFEVW